MDITQWYAVALGGLVAFFILAYLLLPIINIDGMYASFYFLKYVFYPQIHRYLRGSEKTTRFDVVLILTFLVGNILCTTIGVRDVSELINRSALISTVNLMPLSLGAHMNLVASSCGIRLPAYARMHRWLGTVAIAEGVVHMAAAASFKKPGLQSEKDVAAVTAASTMIVMLISSFAGVRRYTYEVFSKLHLIFTAIVIAAIYVHSPSKKLFASPTVYLFAAICLQILISILRFGQVLYRNVKYKKPFTRVTVRTITFKRPYGRDIPVSDAVHVHVQLSRPWTPKAGQYVYLCIPGTSYTSFAQSHPFYVAWWYRDAEGNDFVVLIVQKRTGFTKNLLLHATNGLEPDAGSRAVIEGPYGKELDLESYGTVLLFATGIGIAAQLPYVRRLLEGYHNCEVKTRRIALFWEIDSELHAAWVADMMKELLEKDVDKILDVQLFVLGNYVSTNRKLGDVVSLGKRIDMNYQPMDAESLIKTQSAMRKGRTVISLCTNNDTSDKIREIVLRILDRNIHLKELDFRPYSPHGGKGRFTGMLGRDRSEGRVGKV